jgi:hypothetical protein
MPAFSQTPPNEEFKDNVRNAIKLSTWPCGARGSAGVERKAASRHDDGS